MNTTKSTLLLAGLIGLVAGMSSGCVRRMTVATGTTIGLHATPGDGQNQSPQITLAYKRAEIALVPTAGQAATKTPASDAFSALAVIDFQTRWFRDTKIDQFIATGFASRDIQASGSEFTRALAQGGDVRDAIVEEHIYRSLKEAAAKGNSEAQLNVRDMEALGELEPDDYSYIAISTNAPITYKRTSASRSSTPTPNYDSFKLYRARLQGSVNVLRSAASVSVVQLDGTNRTFAGDDLKRELARYERSLEALQERVASQGATRRALAYYFETLKR